MQKHYEATLSSCLCPDWYQTWYIYISNMIIAIHLVYRIQCYCIHLYFYLDVVSSTSQYNMWTLSWFYISPKRDWDWFRIFRSVQFISSRRAFLIANKSIIWSAYVKPTHKISCYVFSEYSSWGFYKLPRLIYQD